MLLLPVFIFNAAFAIPTYPSNLGNDASINSFNDNIPNSIAQDEQSGIVDSFTVTNQTDLSGLADSVAASNQVSQTGLFDPAEDQAGLIDSFADSNNANDARDGPSSEQPIMNYTNSDQYDQKKQLEIQNAIVDILATLLEEKVQKGWKPTEASIYDYITNLVGIKN